MDRRTTILTERLYQSNKCSPVSDAFSKVCNLLCSRRFQDFVRPSCQFLKIQMLIITFIMQPNSVILRAIFIWKANYIDTLTCCTDFIVQSRWNYATNNASNFLFYCRPCLSPLFTIQSFERGIAVLESTKVKYTCDRFIMILSKFCFEITMDMNKTGTLQIKLEIIRQCAKCLMQDVFEKLWYISGLYIILVLVPEKIAF